MHNFLQMSEQLQYAMILGGMCFHAPIIVKHKIINNIFSNFLNKVNDLNVTCHCQLSSGQKEAHNRKSEYTSVLHFSQSPN